jgi:hypothetical protein
MKFFRKSAVGQISSHRRITRRTIWSEWSVSELSVAFALDHGLSARSIVIEQRAKKSLQLPLKDLTGRCSGVTP